MYEKANAYRGLVEKPEENRPLERHKRRWVDNIKLYLQEIGFKTWFGLIWLRIGINGGLL
jgi:hypothetical protein